MTREREPSDPRIRAALTEGLPQHAPDGLLGAVVRRTADVRQGQRAGWSWIMTSGALAGAGATILVLVLAAGLWRQGPELARPGSSAETVAPSAPVPSIPVDGTCQPDSTCLGILKSGTTSTRVFSPAFAFTLPTGWMNRVDQGGVFELRPIARPLDMVGVYRHPAAVQGGRTVPGIAERADALMAFLAADPELTLTSVHAVTVGGLSGMVADVAIAPGAAQSSLDCPGTRCVTILTGLDPAERPVWSYRTALPAESRSRIYLLDAPDGVILVQVTAWDASTFEALMASAGLIVDSFRFSR